jgi:hypothetical protein
VSKSDRHQKVEDRDPKRAVGFAERPVLPGEDQEEFDALREELYLEYEPQGPAEEDAVETIAEAIWRKSHLGMFQRAFEARMKWGTFYQYPGDPYGDSGIAAEGDQRVIASVVGVVTHFVKTLQANEVPGIDINQGSDIDKQLTNSRKPRPQPTSKLEAGLSQPRRATLDVIRRALEAAGVEFTYKNGGGPGADFECDHRKNRGNRINACLTQPSSQCARSARRVPVLRYTEVLQQTVEVGHQRPSGRPPSRRLRPLRAPDDDALRSSCVTFSDRGRGLWAGRLD